MTFLPFQFQLINFLNLDLKVNHTLQTLADTNIENTKILNKLAEQTEDFAVELIDQVNASEQLIMQDVPGKIDRCASMLSGMTDKAISYSQKKVSIFIQRRKT